MIDAAITAAATRAQDAASAAMSRSRVTVRTTDRLDELGDIFELYRRIWGPDEGSLSISTSMLRAVAKAGGYVAGAWSEQELVGLAVGFNDTPPHRHLHSHIAGIHPAAQGRGIGEAMKLHQRAWALEAGITSITWTFDPLVSRNAHFNIAKLGAVPAEYLPDFYGAMGDAVNAGEATDRMLAVWDLLAELPAAVEPGVALITDDASGLPEFCDAGDSAVSIRVPEDIVALRATDPDRAQCWRHAVRDAFLGEFSRGASVVGFDRRHGYLLTRPRPQKDNS
jgi:predicted GNAT superfamily acetyltransferase